MGQILTLHLEGPDAEFGKIPAADIARLIDGWERALGRAAEARVRRRARTGRRGGPVERATHLIFRDIQRGSVIAVLELPEVDEDEEGALDLDDARLGELAAEDTFALLDNPEKADTDERVVDALLQLGSELGIGSRYDSLSVEWDRGGTTPQVRRAELTLEKRERLSLRRASLMTDGAQDATVVGTLVEADFEHHSARVLTSDQQHVAVTFHEDQADEIQMWLRRPGEVEGRVRFDPRTGMAVSVDLHRIMRPHQLQAIVDLDEFTRHVSVEQLAAEQGVHEILDVDALSDSDASDDELDAFLAALRR